MDLVPDARECAATVASVGLAASFGAKRTDYTRRWKCRTLPLSSRRKCFAAHRGKEANLPCSREGWRAGRPFYRTNSGLSDPSAAYAARAKVTAQTRVLGPRSPHRAGAQSDGTRDSRG